MSKYQESPLRKLARSNYWQTIYARAKELGFIQVFDNNKDFSVLQVIMFQWLEIYNSLYSNSSGEDYLNDDVINDEIRTDAYLYYKRKRRENKLYDKQERDNENKKSKDNSSAIPSMNFKRNK